VVSTTIIPYFSILYTGLILGEYYILHTARKRLKNGTLEEWLKKTLEAYIHNPDIDPYSLLPPK